MSHAGKYLKSAMSIVTHLEEGKPHSSITDWVEVLSSDRYDELSLDGIPELVESINIQGYQGTIEAARAIRKKLKYGNVHRQIRALVILRSLTENAGKGFQVNWANQQLLERLTDMAKDSLLDPKVKRQLIHVFHAWSIQYKDEPRMQEAAGLYRKYGGAGPGVKKATPAPAVPSYAKSTSTSAPAARSAPTTTSAPAAPQGGFTDIDEIFGHTWAPAAGQRGPDTYADLAAAKAEADSRKREREARILLEQREAEVARKEREFQRRKDMAALEARRQKEAAEEAERRRLAKEQAKKKGAQPKKPPFNFEREKPQIMVSIATCSQTANDLVNSCRLINREEETLQDSPTVQNNLDKAKAARRTVIRYLQVVTDESFVGTLLDANEKVVEAIQLYDRLCKPAVLDSDSENEAPTNAKNADDPIQMEAINRRLAAQKLEADRTGELQQLQDRQKRESERRQQKRAQAQSQARQPSRQTSRNAHPDLHDLDFGNSISSNRQLPPPMVPDSDRDTYDGGSLSDFSDYDSSDEEWQAAHGRSGATSRRQSVAAKATNNSNAGPSKQRNYASLDDDYPQGKSGLLDPNDPFGDPFADDNDTPAVEKQRMQWTEI